MILIFWHKDGESLPLLACFYFEEQSRSDGFAA